MIAVNHIRAKVSIIQYEFEEAHSELQLIQLCLSMLTLSCNGYITEGLLVTEMLEGGYHVGLEIVPSEAELLVIPRHGESKLWTNL